MKPVSGKVQIYSISDGSGEVIRGTSLELAEKYDVEQALICKCAREGRKMLGRYSVVKDSMEERPEIAERRELVKKLYHQGVNMKQMAAQTNMAYSTIQRYVQEMKESGEIA